MTGKPYAPPTAIAWRIPFSTAGMNWRGIAPPTMRSSNTKPAPRSSGSIRTCATPNWPCPPLCFLWRPSASAVPLTVSRKGSLTSSRWTSTPNFPRQSFEDNLEVELPEPGEHGLVRLVVSVDTEREVLLLKAVEGGHQLVLVAGGVRADSDRRAWAQVSLGSTELQREIPSAQKCRQARHCQPSRIAMRSPATPRSSRASSCPGGATRRAAVPRSLVLEFTSTRSGRRVPEQTCEQGDPADEGVDRRLDDPGDGWAFASGGTSTSPSPAHARDAAVARDFADEVQQAVDRHLLTGRAAKHREHCAGADSFARVSLPARPRSGHLRPNSAP